MEVILLQDIDALGSANEVVNVKPGYGRNFLIPQRMAIVANDSNKKQYSEIIKQQKAKVEKMLEEFRTQATKIEEASIKVGAKVGTSGKIFGSITNVQLTEALKQASGVEVDRKKVVIKEDDIKGLGTYKAEVTLHPKVKQAFEFEVVAE